MKRIVILCSAVALFVMGASADLAVSFYNGTAFFGKVGTDTVNDFDPASYLQSEAMAQLIWSETAPSGPMAGVGVGGAMLPGEVLLETLNLNDAAYGGWGPGAGITYKSDLINASPDYDTADINAGFIYARVFEGNGAAGENYYTGQLAVDTSGWVLVPSDPSTVYTASIMEGVVVNIDAQGTTVIPEPATIGLMGIAGLGMFLARRKARR